MLFEQVFIFCFADTCVMSRKMRVTQFYLKDVMLLGLLISAVSHIWESTARIFQIASARCSGSPERIWIRVASLLFPLLVHSPAILALVLYGQLFQKWPWVGAERIFSRSLKRFLMTIRSLILEPWPLILGGEQYCMKTHLSLVSMSGCCYTKRLKDFRGREGKREAKIQREAKISPTLGNILSDVCLRSVVSTSIVASCKWILILQRNAVVWDLQI